MKYILALSMVICCFFGGASAVEQEIPDMTIGDMMMQLEIGEQIDELFDKKTDEQKKQIFAKAILALKGIEKQYEKFPTHKKQIILVRQIFEQKLENIVSPQPPYVYEPPHVPTLDDYIVITQAQKSEKKGAFETVHISGTLKDNSIHSLFIGDKRVVPHNGTFAASAVLLYPDGGLIIQLYDEKDSIVFADRIFPILAPTELTIEELPIGDGLSLEEEVPLTNITPPTEKPTPSMHPFIPTRVVEQITTGDVFLSGNALRFRIAPGNHADTRIQKATLQVSLIGFSGMGKLELYRDTLSASNLVASTPIAPVTDPTSSSLSQNITLNVDSNQQNAVTEQHSSHEFIVVIRDVNPDSSVRNPHWSMRLESLELNIGGNVFDASEYGNIAELPFHSSGTR